MPNMVVPLGGKVEVEVDFDYTPGCRGVHTLGNGDPGWPAEDPEIEITAATIGDQDALDFLSEARHWADEKGRTLYHYVEDYIVRHYENDDGPEPEDY